MPVSRDRFVECLTTAGLLSTAELAELATRTAAEPKLQDCNELAHELVRVGKLTKYQAAAIYQEKLDALVLGNYVIIDKLGAGGMGQVFRARHRKMDRVVALKLLPKKALSSPDAVERFHREVKAAARLVHSHIVTALDADAGGGTHFLVMEYIEGHDLSALVKKEGPLPVSKAVTYTLQAARGLEHAHAENVIHRDVKPSNLLVDKRGTVKILDMGLARFSDLPDSANVVDTSGANQLTQAGNIMGTVDYMAPEQAVDTRQADERADIYSLGCALCYLLTGRPPFEGDTMMARLVAHRDAPIPSLRKLRPDVPAALESLFQHMLAKRPEDRPQTMTEIIATLETIAGTRAAATRTWRLPWILAGGCAAAAALVAVATLAVSKGDGDSGLQAIPRETPAGSPALPTIATASQTAPKRRASGPPSTADVSQRPQLTRPKASRTAAPVIAADPITTPPARMVDRAEARAQPAKPKALNSLKAGAKPTRAAVATPVKLPPSPTLAQAPRSSPPATAKPPATVQAAVAKGHAATETTKATDVRMRIPSAAAQAEALKTVKSVFAEEYAAARQVDGKKMLIDKLLKQAGESGDDPAAQYVLLSEACDQAAELADVVLIDKASTALVPGQI